ncbi:MAG: isoprenyl transferase [Magnetospirillum sp. WYHS-4]
MTAAPQPQDPSPSPVHVAIIMDGNGRWARARGLPRVAGHRRGAEAVRTTIRAAVDSGVKYLTLYGFSSENWKRPASEVADLMGLLRLYLRNEIASLHEGGVCLRIIGDRTKLSDDIVTLIEDAERLTVDNRQLVLTMALSYGGRAEIACAARRLAEKVKAGELDPAAIDEDSFARHLFTEGLPDPDILIRTSGEKRISNFLLWQLAYTEFVFVDTLWPDFSQQDFRNALGEYRRRERRYGRTNG